MKPLSDTDVGNVLRSLIEDNDTAYGCLETIEPYVNANRDGQLDDASVLAVLGEMRALGLLSTHRFVPIADEYEPADDAPIDSDTWYRATNQGVLQYDAKYSAIVDV